jgi:hypothetical protein
MNTDFDGRTPNGTHPDDGDRSYEDCMGAPAGYLAALERAVTNSLGSHLDQQEVVDLIDTMAELARQRDKLIARVRELENRANLVAGMAQHHPDMQGQFRGAVFILTGAWPADAKAEA